MGLYDYINEEQVKCFYNILYMAESLGGNLWHSGGMMNSYKNGDVVPNKSLYYNYGNNFIVFDDFEKIAHWIKDNKVYRTVYENDLLLELKDVDFNKTQVITYYGERIKILKPEDLLNYSKEIEEKNNKLYDVFKESSKILDKNRENSHKLMSLNRDSFLAKRGKYFEDIMKDDELFKDINKENYKNLDDIHDDKELVERLTNYYQSKSDINMKKYSEVREKEEPIGIEVNNNFSKKWDYYHDIKDYYDYKYFGSLISAISYKDKIRDEKDYLSCREEISKYLFDKKIDFNKYCECFHIEEEMQEFIKRLLAEIFKDIK